MCVCAIAVYRFSCLHMAPDKCRMQSALPGAQHALPSPLCLLPSSCLNLSLPVSTHFLLRNCPVALTWKLIFTLFHCGSLRQSCKWIRATLDIIHSVRCVCMCVGWEGLPNSSTCLNPVGRPCSIHGVLTLSVY